MAAFTSAREATPAQGLSQRPLYSSNLRQLDGWRGERDKKNRRRAAICLSRNGSRSPRLTSAGVSTNTTFTAEAMRRSIPSRRPDRAAPITPARPPAAWLNRCVVFFTEVDRISPGARGARRKRWARHQTFRRAPGRASASCRPARREPGPLWVSSSRRSGFNQTRPCRAPGRLSSQALVQTTILWQYLREYIWFLWN